MVTTKQQLVNANELQPTLEYVCWIDIMGTKNIMSISLAKAANFILKFHASINNIKEKEVKCYPLMDGVFITCKELETLKKVINNIYTNIANIFSKETKFEHKFIIRGALAYGEIINGCDISDKACQAFNENTNYRDSLLLGMPMVQAFGFESFAPPFGMYIHESARKYEGLQGCYYKWQEEEAMQQLKKKTINYFEECQKRIHYLDMKEEKLKFYKELIEEYLLTCGDSPTKARKNK